jgi:hypothetical protein
MQRARAIAYIFMFVILLSGWLMLPSQPVKAQTVAQVAPTIKKITPDATYKGMPVAIEGCNFFCTQLEGFSKVTFNGVDAGKALYWSSQYIVVTVPEDATSGPVVVTTIFGSSNSCQFTVLEQPTIMSCYLAEGTTRPGFEEWLTLYNPWDEECAATVEYMIADAANRMRIYNVPAHTRLTVYVNSEIGSDHDVSVYVTSPVRLYVERPMYFRYKDKWSGGHDTMPALQTSETWYFAEGTTRSGFEEWLCLANPGLEEAKVNVTYIFADGQTTTLPYTVPPLKRYTIDVNSTVGPERDVGLKVESNVPVVAERPMYFDYHAAWDGGHITMGTPVTCTSWYFAEGTTRSGFEEWLCLANPGEVEANVSLRFSFQNGAIQNKELLINPGQRVTINVNEVVGPEKDVAVSVEAGTGITAERSLYFLYHGLWDGGSNTTGCSGSGQ